MTHRKPHVLLLAPVPPYPFDGGSKRIHTLCSLLRDRFRFSLLTFRPRHASGSGALEDFQREQTYLKDVFDEVRWVDPPAEFVDEVDGLELSVEARRFYSDDMRRALSEILARGGVDLVHVEFDLMAAYALSPSGVPMVLTQHDLGGTSFFGSYFREMSGWRKLLGVGDWLGRVRFARRVNRLFDRIILVTDGDLKAASKLAERGKLRVVPTGVDVGHFRSRDAGRAPANVAFVGHYPHFPNEDAAVWLCREIFPKVRALRADTTLTLIGSSPTPAVLAASGGGGVTVTGTVPDVSVHLREASVFAAPVRLGKGIKGKILEAFAAGVPVVAHSRAASGIDATPGRELLVADDAEGFAAAIVRLLEDEGLRDELAKNGRNLVESRYDWRMIAPKLADVYSELLDAQ